MSLSGVRIRRSWLLGAAVFLGLAGAGLWRLRQRGTPDDTAEIDAAYARGDWQTSAVLARQRLKESPADPRAMRLAARSAARQDQDPRAIALYDRIDRRGFAAEDCFLLGRALVRRSRIDAGLKALEAAREQAPDHPERLAALAGLYLQSYHNEAAEAAALRLAKQPRWEARAQVLLGTARSASHDPAGAAEALQRWAQLDPDGRVVAPGPPAQIKTMLARSWLEAAQPAKARTVLESLLRNGPDAEASWLLCRSFLQEKNWKQAAMALKDAPSFRAENPVLPEPSPYVGAAQCRECHRPEYDALLASRHASTFTRARDVSGLALPAGPLPDPGNPRVTHHFKRAGQTLVVETKVDDRAYRAVVDYMLGSADHLATFVGRDDHGQTRMIRLSPYRSRETHGGTGWDLATGLPPKPAHEDEYLGKAMLGADALRRCLNCHTTNLRAAIHESGPEAADRSIGCEQCHGPAGHHVAAVAASFADTAIDSQSEAAPVQVDRVCAKCHGNLQPQRVGRPRTDPAWLRFQSLTLTWSRCSTESDGSLGCVTCHEPHHRLETSEAWYEARCLACHAPGPRSNSASLSSQGPTSGNPPTSRPGNTRRVTEAACRVNPTHGCVGCHLPRVWVPSTHSFKSDHYIRIREPTSADPGRTAGDSAWAAHQ